MRWVDQRGEEVGALAFLGDHAGDFLVGLSWAAVLAVSGGDGLGRAAAFLSEFVAHSEREFLEDLYANPWVTDASVRLVHGAQYPLALLLLTSPAGWPLAIAVDYVSRRNEGVPWPSTRLEDTVATVIALGELAGWWEDGQGRSAQVRPYPAAVDSEHLPGDLEGLSLGLEDVNRYENWGPNRENPNEEFSTVRVMSVTQPDGSRAWVVQIPGTQVWPLTSGANPVDATNNLRLVAGQDTAQNDAIRDAMRQARIPSDEPVLLMGYSQGGITAMSLASHPETLAEFRVTNVMTVGSPVSRFTPPDGVSVLSLEHEQDPVPRLDGGANPDDADWVTVRRDSTGDLGRPVKDANDNLVDNPVDSAFEAHVPQSNYNATARYAQESGDPSVDRVVDGMSVFMSDDPDAVRTQDFRMTRELPEE
jgi:pimeloyl-ACP methyl ester carboxylesterase